MSEHSFMDDYTRPPATPPARGYSLAALFLLVTTAGIVAALARNASLGSDWKLQANTVFVLVHAAVGLVAGAAVGFVTGLAYPRSTAGALLGASIGGLTGGICVAIVAAGASFWLFLAGGAALVLMGACARFGQRRRSR